MVQDIQDSISQFANVLLANWLEICVSFQSK